MTDWKSYKLVFIYLVKRGPLKSNTVYIHLWPIVIRSFYKYQLVLFGHKKTPTITNWGSKYNY